MWRSLLAFLVMLPALASAQVPDRADAAVAPAAEQSGRDIYERVLANRHRAFFQKQKLVSRDASGASSTMELWTRWKDARDENGEVHGHVLSKALAKYTEPRDVRGVGYLIVQNDDRPSDQFIYLPSLRRVRRIQVDEAILGTDFSIEDLVPREIETSEYRRVADEAVDGVPCFVVEVVPKASADSQYSKLWIHVEKSHYVPILTRYWDLEGVEVKRQTAPAAEIEAIEGVWLARQTTMSDLIEGSSTTLYVLEMEKKTEIKDSLFTARALEQKSR